ncbi:MAG: PGF-CTERM-anchored ABC transporter substrate-binding protein [Halanaeroarchaeum sp.]
MTTRTILRTLVLLGLVATLVGAGVTPGVAAGANADQAGATQPDTCDFPIESTDATGTAVTVENEPETVVTLGPSAAQTMWEIGAREKVIGVSQYAKYLEGAESRTNVSGAARSYVDVETVVALEPDLVLAPNIIPDETVAKLRSTGLTVYKFERATSLHAVVEKTRLIGRLTGACAGADERATEMNRTIAAVRDAVANADRPRVLYMMGGGYTAGEGTFIDAIIEAAGGTNVAAEAGIEGYGTISAEVVAKRDPAWIVVSSGAPTVPQGEAFEESTAYREGNVFVVDANYINQPAPRTVRVVERMAATFHPDRYAGAPPYEMAQLTTATPATTTSTGTSTPTTTTTTPGMGIPVVVLAVALVGFALGRD